MRENDLISVIIPVYNREKTINRAINSVLHQTYQNFEIIVVDDCSSDQSVKIVKSFIQNDFRIQLLINNINQGPNYTRNRGIKQAQGKYIILLDSDDDWEPETLELLYKKIIKTPPKVGLVYPGMNLIQPSFSRKIYPKYRGRVFKKLMTQGVIGVYPLIKREVFEKTGLFDESEILRKGGHQDYEMWIRIALYYEFEYVNRPLLNHYFHQASITYESLIKKPYTKIKAYLYIWRKYKNYISDDADVYVFYCFKIFELLCLAHNQKTAKKIIFMAYKTNPFKIRSYYHLISYLHDFYSPIKFFERIHEIIKLFKELYERIIIR
ncbi:glycosyltransferase family 2 protein [Candidatus Harpocratesius sp.]